MKKKWILMAVVALLLALGGVALADEVEHDCNVLGHDWLWSSFYDGTHQGRCSVCGTQTIREAHTVPEGMGVACVEEGTICPVCGLRFDSGIGHNWQSNGNGTHSCTRCGVAAEACTGGEATCEHGAICEICGGEYTAKADHDWLWATFYDGTHQATCAECRVKTTREAHTVPEGMGVACVEEGTICPVCGLRFDSGIGHNWQSNGNGTHSCTRCGVAAEACTGGKATCEHGAICEICGGEYGEPLPHTPVTDAAVAPTCTATGLTEGTHCAVCGTVLVKQIVIPATGHTEAIIPGFAPTCTSTGLTAGKRCAVCGEILVKQMGLAMTGHAYKASNIAPTCTEGGYTKYICANCGASYTTNETNARGHYYGEWTPSDGAHSALCQRTGCEHTRTVACESFAWRLFVGEAAYDFAFCPVCGEANDGAHLSWVEEAGAEALTKNLPRGEIVLRVGALANGEAVMSVGFEYSGELTQPAGEVKVTLPAALLEGYTLTLLEADGAESELLFAVEGEEISFTLDFAPVEDEEPIPVRVIRLIPVAG